MAGQTLSQTGKQIGRCSLRRRWNLPSLEFELANHLVSLHLGDLPILLQIGQKAIDLLRSRSASLFAKGFEIGVAVADLGQLRKLLLDALEQRFLSLPVQLGSGGQRKKNGVENGKAGQSRFPTLLDESRAMLLSPFLRFFCRGEIRIDDRVALRMVFLNLRGGEIRAKSDFQYISGRMERLD